jgi:putative transposase
LLHDAIDKTQIDWPMTIHEMVLLPDHLHLLCSIDDAKQDYSTRIRVIKKRFTRAWLASGGHEGPATASRQQRGIRGVWQKRFYEHTIRNQSEMRAHVAYVHMNPVKHGLVTQPKDWPWSTFHRHVKEGMLPPDWMGPTELASVGEYDSEIW